MGKLFLPRFQEMVAELEAHPDITAIESDIPAAASAKEIESAKRLVKGDLPDGVEAFYSEMNGFLLAWESEAENTEKDNAINKGAVEILPITEVLKDWKETTWFDFEGGDLFKPVKPLDFFTEEACSALHYSESKGFKSTIHYHYMGESLYDTGYNFNEFIDRLILARGFWYWIETLCTDTQQSPQSRNFFRQMPLLFADFQPSLFKPGLASEPKGARKREAK